MATLTLQMPPFDPDSDIGASVAPRWKTWVADFQTYLVANAITDNKRKKALLLYVAGPRVREIFRQIPETGEEDAFDTALTKLNEYFEPQKNTLYEVYKFRQAAQGPQETLDQYHMRLRTLGATCYFHDLDFEILVQIVTHGKSTHLRKYALKDPKIKLKDVLLAGRQEEVSKFQAATIEGRDSSAPRETEVSFVKNTRNPRNKSRKNGKTCKKCGREWPHKNGECPAQGQTCRKCNKQNHFAAQCRSKSTITGKSTQVRPLDANNSDSDDSNYCYAVETNRTKHPTVNLTMNGQKVKFTIDTGSSINVISPSAFQSLQDVQLKGTNIKAFPFHSTTPVKMKGKFQTTIESRKKMTVATIYVTADDGGCLLSSNTAQELGLISLHLQTLQASKTRTKDHMEQVKVEDPKVKEILHQFSERFTGLGKLKGKQIQLSIDQSVKPVAQQQRRVPFHLREKVEMELKNLESQDIIEKVPESEHTDWVSPIVVVPKKEGKIRICVDMRAANTAVKRIRHPIPTVKDIALELNGAKYFSKLDLAQAYHQLELAPESRSITTFTTPFGLYRSKRLNYGTNSSAEIFQHALQQSLQGIEGVRNLADDIIVFGKTYEAHNKSLKACLQRLQEHNLTLNINKCKFLKQNLEFFGFLFTAEGTQPDPKKVSAFVESKPPKSVSEVRSYLGMANYSAQFIENFATISEPLRKLTCKDAKFEWGTEQQKAYETLKTALLKSPVMSYFDINKETMIHIDASPVGLSAILSQRSKGSTESHIIAYASKSLTATEKRYSQTEKEALAIVWGIEHFHLYVYGAPFILYTDHKPLELIYANPMSKPPARLERWMLRLQQYDFKVIYKEGPENPADYLSRHPIEPERQPKNIAEEYVNFIAHAAVPQAMTLAEIQEATQEDATLRVLRAAIKTGVWTSDRLTPYKQIKHEITVDHTNKILLRGTRIILPASLREHAIKLAHQGHQGQSKTTALLREYVWFPNMGQSVKSYVDRCIVCQASARPNAPEPLQSTAMPNRPWEEIKVDFCGPFPSGHYLLVVIDCYSRFPEVEILKSTAAPKVIPKLDTIFARHGIPTTVTSDNGPPFQSDEFSRYMRELGIKHDPATPLWPQGNSEVEAFNKPLEKAIRAAWIEKRPWQQELSKFLLNYRSTPHSTTKVPPAELLYNRKIKGKLPDLRRKVKIVNRHKEARDNQEINKEKSRNYANQRRNVKEANLKVGDTVLVKQTKKNKLSTNFDTRPHIVTQVRGSRITAEFEGRRITRNSSFFKKLVENTEHSTEDDNDIPVDYRGNEQLQQQQQVVRRSNRERRPTNRYGELVDSSLIH